MERQNQSEAVDIREINPSFLLLCGNAKEIDGAVEYEANQTVQLLHDSTEQKHVNAEKIKNYTDRVNEKRQEVVTIKIALNSADSKLAHGKKTDPVLKEYLLAIERANLEDSIITLVDFLAHIEKRPISPQQYKTLPQIRSHISRSMKSRIEISWCWNEILEIRRLVLVSHVVILADQLTDIAIKLKDDKAIQKVREMLEKLNFSSTSDKRQSSLDLPPDELKQILEEGIANLEQSYERITGLEGQQGEIKGTIGQLDTALKVNEQPERTEEPATPQTPKEIIRPATRMHTAFKRNKRH